MCRRLAGRKGFGNAVWTRAVWLVRSFRDRKGGAWDVVLGRESWGALYALFVPVEAARGEGVRQALLRAESYTEAQQQIEEMGREQLANLFATSQPKP